MVKRQAILIITGIGIILALGLLPGIARADPTATPTASLTYTPWPIPTRAHQFLRVTPTPWQITPSGAVLDLGGDAKAGQIADTIINGYRFINFGATDEHGGVFDLIMFFAVGFLVIQAIMSLIEGTADNA
jgi:hypothetical protein